MAMIGGMIGNNSYVSNSVLYGSTREHLIKITCFIFDGSKVTFRPLSTDEYYAKIANTDGSLEAKVYQHIHNVLSDPGNIREIEKEFPKTSIVRRNTGYAIDMLARMQPFKR